MSSLNKLSTIVDTQLPGFIRENHPIFVEFLQKYYEFLETPGNAVYELKRFDENYDIDTARANLLQYFKNKILPSFPDDAELTTERIIKSAREFYAKKGTPDSFKFLFRILYDKDVEIFFPKLQILKASDGKWAQPQAFRLTLSQNNLNLDLNVLEKKKAYGSISRASCVIEAANRTLDKPTNKEIVEIYVSNLNRFFQNGEYLEVEYVDENDIPQVFSEKIIGAISNIKINPKRRGRKYNTGDPVIIAGGLDPLSETRTKAVATVGNVTTGSIDSVTVLTRGYGFRTSPNSLIDIITANGVGANIIINSVDTANAIQLSYSTDSILYQANAVLNVADYDFDNTIGIYSNSTVGSGNSTSTVNLSTATFLNDTTGLGASNNVTNAYNSLRLEIVAGTGSSGAVNSSTIIAYNGTTKIATLADNLTIAPGATSNVFISCNSNTIIGKALSFANINVSPIFTVDVLNGGSFFDEEPILNAISLYESNYSSDEGFILIPPGEFNTYNNVTASIRFSGSNYSNANDWYTGFRIIVEKQYRTIIDYDGATKTAFLNRKFENNINQTNILTKNLFLDFRPLISDMGRIAAVEVLNGGTAYHAANTVSFTGTGVGAAATLTVSSGVITAVTLSNRGEGYPVAPTVTVNSGTGSGAVLRAIMMSEGEDFDVVTGDIGQIRDFNITNRGSDYITTPNVSMKIYDINVASILESESILEGDILYQGSNSNSTSFRATVETYYPANNVIRVYDFSGTPNVGQNLIVVKTTSANVNALVQSANIDGKVYPYKYGDGKAKANASFLNGLIKYNGFYLNTDGHLSSDKKIQDGEKYHNYSYSLVSEVQAAKYSKTILDTVHPTGTRLLSTFVVRDNQQVDQTSNVNIHSTILTSNSLTTNCNVGYNSTIVTGMNESFDIVANTNDFITINSANTIRKFVKVITGIANNNSLNIESACILIGQGRARTNSNNAVIHISGNSNLLPLFIDTGDKIRINVGNNILTKTINSISGNAITLNSNTDIASSNTNLVYEILPQFNTVDYQIVRTLY